jgi:HAD superfamily hydrolase (TIGR01459 family)
MTFIERFAPLASNYDVLLCDVWGVVHNGVAAFTEAAEALARFRARGGTVIFITNAPYPADAVHRFLDRLGVRRDAYDAIMSSGDVTRGVVEKRLAQRVFHLGPPRDLPIFAGLKVAFAPVESADYVVCSGLFDDRTETPENYRDILAFMRSRSLFMVCANPDTVVERGDTSSIALRPWPTRM